MAESKITKDKSGNDVGLYSHSGKYKNDKGVSITTLDSIDNYSLIIATCFTGSISSSTRFVVIAAPGVTGYYPAIYNSTFNWVRFDASGNSVTIYDSSHSSVYIRSVHGIHR